MPRLQKDLLAGVCLLLLIGLAYGTGLHAPFIIDDQHIIVRNFLLRQWTLRDIFFTHLFAPLGIETEYYRPLTLLTFAVNYSFSELNPAGYRLVNLTLHFVAALCVYSLFARLTGRLVAGLSAALFAVHPAAIQAVTYISSRSDPLYTMFTLSGILSWVIVTAHRLNGQAWRCASFTLLFLALFAKEAAVVAPFLLLVTDIFWAEPGTWRARVKENWRWYFSFLLGSIAYWSIRLWIAGYPLHMEKSPHAWIGGAEFGLAARILLAFKLLWSYLTILFFPLNLAFFRTLAVPQNALDLHVIGGIIACFALVTLAYFSYRSCRTGSYGVVWFLLSLAPVLNLTPLNAAIMEHWLYLPLAGFALAFVSYLNLVARRLLASQGVMMVFFLIIALLLVRTISRNNDWADPVRFFQNEVRLYPGEAKSWFLLGYTLLERGSPERAVDAYETGLRINPKYPYGWSGLGEAYAKIGKGKEAEESILRAITLLPKNPWFHYVLGAQRLLSGNVDGAVENLDQATRLNPSFVLAYHLLGSAYSRTNEKIKAGKTFDRALELLPEGDKTHTAVHVEMGKMYAGRNKIKEAIEEFRLALRFDPGNIEAERLLRETATTKADSRASTPIP